MAKPIIGISGGEAEVLKCDGGKKMAVAVDADYVKAISENGGIPVILPSDIGKIENSMEWLDGVLFTGGEDIDPYFYQEVRRVMYRDCSGIGEEWIRPKSFAPNSKRDFLEINLYKAAKEKKIPILGICRGAQIMNVAEGRNFISRNRAKRNSSFYRSRWNY